MSKTLIVIGGGAAGFFCAVNAARLNPDIQVSILEKTGKLLSKVRVSGGGRCNVTHRCIDIAEMSGNYPRGFHFVKKMFHQFFTVDTIDWFAQRNVLLKTEEDGRMFPTTNTAETIVDCLIKEANTYHVDILLNREVLGIEKVDKGWLINLSGLVNMQADYVCIACGGYPKASMFEWLIKTGHTIEAPLPSLFTFNLAANPITKLMGISVPRAQVKIAGTKLMEKGPVLITHWGLSGPAILRLSAGGARELAAHNYTFGIVINWLPAYNEMELREQFSSLRFELAAQPLSHKNPMGLPQRLWEYLLNQSGIPEKMRYAELPVAFQNRLIKNLHEQALVVKGKTTFKEEFVTAGGIKLSADRC